MEKLLIEIADYLINMGKLHSLDTKIHGALRKYNYPLAIKLREEQRKLEKTISIKKIKKLKDELTTKNR